VDNNASLITDCPQWWSDRAGATGLALYGRKLWETLSSHWPTADDHDLRGRSQGRARSDPVICGKGEAVPAVVRLPACRCP
jgi:hypothetical protein